MKAVDNNEFHNTVMAYYQARGRHDLPWRLAGHDGLFDPYKILVSEIMLQQTQVPRVIPKFNEFMKRFPTAKRLAEASLGEALSAWQGLGYNRRAKYLQDATRKLVIKDHPWQYEDLLACTGIGPNTAAAVVVYAYNRPHVFIE